MSSKSDLQQILDDMARVLEDYDAGGIDGVNLDTVRMWHAQLTDAVQQQCCVCGSAAVVYRNYRDQEFCGPCADGKRPTGSEER